MAKKIRKAETPDWKGLVRLFLTMSLIGLSGVLAILAALGEVIPWLYAIIIWIGSGVVGWIFILRTMSRAGMLSSLRRTIGRATVNPSQKRP